MAKSLNSLKVIPLGGIGEIGKNLTVLEYKNNILIVDCGMTFPDEDMPGIDIVIPDITYLERNREKIRGIVVTHGHEDHIGAIPYVLKKLKVPVYGTRLTMALLANKFKEHGVSRKFLKTVNMGDSVKLGCFSVEFVRATHSIPDSACLSITTPVGVVVFTGDFKVDFTPIDGKHMDLQRLAEIGKQGVLLMLADSTNAERPGHSPSELTVADTFKSVFSQAKSRILVATFASNLFRIQQVITAAEEAGRKVALSGRSMLNTVSVAQELGYLKMRKDTLVDLYRINKIPPHKICLLTTGSQGEPMSALTRMANRTHSRVKLEPSDTVVISATPIPGNEKTVSSVIDNLMKIGVKVIYSSLADVHVSGHAFQEELKLMHSLIRPRFFMPVHGEYRMLSTHKGIALDLGMKEKDILLVENGNTVEVTRNRTRVIKTRHAANVLIDGLGVGDVGNVVLRDRRHLSEDGLLTVVVTLDRSSKEIVSGPDIISRGFVYVKENEKLMKELNGVVRKTLRECKKNKIDDWGSIKFKIREDLKRFVMNKTKRNPMILPIIMEV